MKKKSKSSSKKRHVAYDTSGNSEGFRSSKKSRSQTENPDIIKDFEKTFGKEKLDKVLILAGHHSALEKPPANVEDKLIFSLLEMLGYSCYSYENSVCSNILKEEEIKRFLFKHRKKVLKLKVCPDYLALISGVYDFLKEKKYLGDLK